MARAESAFLPYGFLQGEDDWDASETDQRHVAEVVDVGPEAGLPVHSQSDQRISLPGGICRRRTLRRQVTLNRL